MNEQKISDSFNEILKELADHMEYSDIADHMEYSDRFEINLSELRDDIITVFEKWEKFRFGDDLNE